MVAEPCRVDGAHARRCCGTAPPDLEQRRDQIGCQACRSDSCPRAQGVKVELFRAPWCDQELAVGDTQLDGTLQGSWKEAALAYAAARTEKLAQGKRPPMGIQPYLNRVIDQRFLDTGWDGEGGRYVRDRTWVRFTFRHQMSLGSDILDAMKVTAGKHADVAIIAAADTAFLKVVSPNDAPVLTSFEKLSTEIRDLAGVIDTPLVIGRLVPVSALPPATTSIIFGPRPRGGTR